MKQKLGKRVLYYYLYQNARLGLVLFIIAIVAFVARGTVVSTFSSSELYHISADTAAIIAGYVVSGLFAIAVLALLYGVFSAWFLYASTTFTVGENAFSIERGIFDKAEISIPYRQIQNVDIEQLFIYRTMGVAKLVILTGGNDSNDTKGEAEGVFPVIDKDVAMKLRDTLLQKANVQTVVSQDKPANI